MTSVAILGAGPAGLGAALALAQRGIEVSLFERQSAVGGNAGSFELAGQRVDYGSHRLHPASDPEVLEWIRGLLGDDLIERPRHGRIRLMGRWIHFPLRAIDLVLRVHPRFALGVGTDLFAKSLTGSSSAEDETFASVLRGGLGRTICEEFYFPYARKIWGMDPLEISPAQARKRVASNSIGKMLRRLVPQSRGTGGSNTKGIFFYPRKGFGQISEALGEAAADAGAEIRMNADVKRVRLGEHEHQIEFEHAGQPQTLRAQHVWSTIPVTVLARLLEPTAPEPVMNATRTLRFRSMLLIYLVLEQRQFSEFDAHYFPGADTTITRLSEPKNYRDPDAARSDSNRTVLCAELPCQQGDENWNHTDETLAQIVTDDLARAGLPISAPIEQVHVRRLSHAYPLYPNGYEAHFDCIDDWLATHPRLLTFGRQGLYAHDNTHHALFMALSAARCLGDDGGFDGDAWARERKIFESHVVED